ncbi:TIGR02281 family clan AA aspartic protease [Amaricoccus sp. B4]|uniref:retropepsin-like aspartic protease family protein n=1 Tax=Amaricoccus sp. B4 TaxID=3368557 RepID=UPI00371C3073
MAVLDDPDTIARLAYLSLLLVFVAGYFFTARRSLGRTLRDVLVWVLIFAMAVIAYGFRDVIWRELMPRTAMQVSGDTVELRRDTDGHFRATLALDGVPVTLVVDTGASQIVLSRADAARIGIGAEALDYSGRARTANGPVAIAPVVLRTVSLGPFTERNVRASVSGGDLHSSLLGMSYLRHFARIEISGDTMRLVR